jgi:hypothetical protein
MQIFVGNPTLQHRSLHYRVPQVKTARIVQITAGGQTKLPDDLSGSDLESVIAQIEALGGVPANDIGSIIQPKGLVYKVSPSPIKADELQEGLERDEAARQEVAGQKMEDAGLAAFNNAQKASGKVVETVMEIVETTDNGAKKGGVDMEVVVSSKSGRKAGRKRTEKKR